MKIKMFLRGVILTIFSFFFVSQTFAILTSPMSNYMDNTGTVIRKDAVFIKAKNVSGQLMPTGTVAIWDTTNDDGMSINMQTSGGTTGVWAACVTVGSLVANQIGNCQVWGYHAGVRFTNATGYSAGVTAGAALYVSGVQGRATAINSVTLGGDNEVTTLQKIPFAVAYDTLAATGNVEAFIRLL